MASPRKPTAREIGDAIEAASVRDEVDQIVGIRRENEKPVSAAPASTESRPPTREELVRGWLYAEKLLEEEADRIAEMSDEEFERLAATMPEPTHIPTEAELDERSARRRAVKGQ